MIRINVTLETYQFGLEEGIFSSIGRRLPLLESHPVTCVFKISKNVNFRDRKDFERSWGDATKKILFKPEMMYPTGIDDNPRTLSENDFTEIVFSDEQRKLRFTIVPPVSGICPIRLVVRPLNDEDELVDEFGNNYTGRDRKQNRYYTKPVRIYSFYEILVIFFALISTLTALASTYLAWYISFGQPPQI